MIQAKQGKIEIKNGKTYLVLQHADVNHVIMFSDRPNRIVKTITGNDLQKLWKVGNDSFEKDPPNAVLSSAGQKAQIVILNGITVTDTTVVFPMSISQDEKRAVVSLQAGGLESVVVMIDTYLTRSETGKLSQEEMDALKKDLENVDSKIIGTPGY